MAGYMVPWVQCEEFDYCGEEVVGSDDVLLRALRRRIALDGWCSHRRGGTGTSDYCPTDGCCPFCSSSDAVRERYTAKHAWRFAVPFVVVVESAADQ